MIFYASDTLYKDSTLIWINKGMDWRLMYKWFSIDHVEEFIIINREWWYGSRAKRIEW